MENQKRYTLTLDLFVYADNDEKAKLISEQIKSILNDIVSIHETPFGTIGEARKIKLDEIVKFKAECAFSNKIIIGVPYHCAGNWYMLVDDFNKTDEIGTGSYPIKNHTLTEYK